MTFVDTRRLITRRRFVPAKMANEETVTAAEEQQAPRLRRIVLTGGPGSGKSTAAAFLAREFVDDLWVLPESATLLYKGGLPRAQDDMGQQVAQRAIYTVQRSLEDATAIQHPGRVQLCDRATIDGAAYWPDGPDAFFRALGTTRAVELSRYDAVVFMHTAARMPAGYERDMDVRTEDQTEAVELDQRMFQLYADHPNLVAVESSASFLDKLTTVRNAIAAMLHPEWYERHDRRESVVRRERPSISADARDSEFPRPLRGLRGGRSAQQPAPVSSLMGLASVHHVLPVD